MVYNKHTFSINDEFVAFIDEFEGNNDEFSILTLFEDRSKGLS